MNSRLTSSPDFTIRQLETPAEIDAFVQLNAETFRPDEDVEAVAARRGRFLAQDPDFHASQLRGAFLGKTFVGGYVLRERQLCLGTARLRTGCVGGVVTHQDYRHRGIATALMQEAEVAEELWWTLPPNSHSLYLLADHLPIHSNADSYPNQGWMARPVHLPTLFRSLLPLWQEHWRGCIQKWSGIFTFNVGKYTCSLALGIRDLYFIESPTADVSQVNPTPQVFTQLLFGFRPLTWLSGFRL